MGSAASSFLKISRSISSGSWLIKHRLFQSSCPFATILAWSDKLVRYEEIILRTERWRKRRENEKFQPFSFSERTTNSRSAHHIHWPIRICVLKSQQVCGFAWKVVCGASYNKAVKLACGPWFALIAERTRMLLWIGSLLTFTVSHPLLPQLSWTSLKEYCFVITCSNRWAESVENEGVAQSQSEKSRLFWSAPQVWRGTPGKALWSARQGRRWANWCWRYNGRIPPCPRGRNKGLEIMGFLFSFFIFHLNQFIFKFLPKAWLIVILSYMSLLKFRTVLVMWRKCNYVTVLLMTFLLNLQKSIEKADVDKYGDVDFVEFVKYVLDHEKSLALVFSNLDQNRDGETFSVIFSFFSDRTFFQENLIRKKLSLPSKNWDCKWVKKKRSGYWGG